jgi:hypothetical protein
MLNYKLASMPIDIKARSSTATGLSLKDNTFYRSITSALQYLMLTRPELAYIMQ